ncbi:MAG: hypothetical protein V3W17_03565 [Desulfobacteria bacterium]
MNVEHRTSNVELEDHSMFDLPEADKCLLAYGELDVGSSSVMRHLLKEKV